MVYFTFHELRLINDRNDCESCSGNWNTDTNICTEELLDDDCKKDIDIDINSLKTDYSVALTVSLISTISPIMFMLSCTIVLKFSQGDYEATQWSRYNKAI